MPLYDLECQSCSRVHEDMQPYNTSGVYELACPYCHETVTHKRLPSLFAQYMGERVLNPIVMGGKFDTAGHGRVTKLPQFREAIEHDAKVDASLARLGPNASESDVREAVKAAGPGPSMADWRSHMKKPEVREAKKQRAEDVRRNKLKRARAGAIKRGENINMRRDRLPGDPKVTG